MVTVCTNCTHKQVEHLGRTKIVMMEMTLVSGDASVVVDTGLRKIFSYTVSPYTLTTKLLLQATISGGVITQVVTDPAAGEVLYYTVFGR
jgi:hypothetical protein